MYVCVVEEKGLRIRVTGKLDVTGDGQQRNKIATMFLTLATNFTAGDERTSGKKKKKKARFVFKNAHFSLH